MVCEAYFDTLQRLCLFSGNTREEQTQTTPRGTAIKNAKFRWMGTDSRQRSEVGLNDRSMLNQQSYLQKKEN
jgi:hypothetical protein